MSRKVRSHCGVPIIGFDTEYQAGASRNEILSYQTFGIVGESHWHWIEVDPGCRITLDRLIGQTLLAGKRAGAFKQYPREIVLVGHFSRADLPMLSDFDELKPDLDVVHDTAVRSVIHPFRGDQPHSEAVRRLRAREQVIGRL